MVFNAQSTAKVIIIRAEPGIGTSEVLRSLRHYLPGHTAKDITPSVAWRKRREAQKEEALNDLH